MTSVQLYVYDLSRGMAKAMSLPLTGKQIDGIWHTSVVVFGREVFFGQGILESVPGKTHHGQPVQVIDCGTTEIDQDTFNEYLLSLRDMYSPAAYHLIEFNCNHFTADVVGFLTSGTIPAWISGLPAEFLSTPFGQSMRPQIDAMFKRTSPSEHRVQGSMYPTPPVSGSSTPTPSANPLANGLLSSVAQQAQASSSSSSPLAQTSAQAALPAPPTPDVPALTPVTSVTYFNTILSQNVAVVANFTNTPGCPPCRAIKPAYESIAANFSDQYKSRGVRFIDVELGVGEGRTLASRFGVSATPTFIFFRDGKKADEMKGADKRGLENKVESFLEDCFPRHPHRKLYLPAIEAIPANPILSSNAPNYSALLGKLEGFSGVNTEDVSLLRNRVAPLLEGKGADADQAVKKVYLVWTAATTRILASLKPEETFPAIDLWRMGLLQPKIVTLLTINLTPTTSSAEQPISPILDLASRTLKATATSTPKPFLLTVLRFLTNLLAPLPLANLILSTPSQSPTLHSLQENVVSVTVDSLLHPDQSVRSAAAGVAINLAAYRHRLSKEQSKSSEDGDEHEWEVELASALIEAVGKEADEDVAHRLIAALGLVVYLSPAWESSLHGLLEVLSAKSTIESRSRTYKKKEVRKLADEFAGKMCPA